VVPTSWLLDLSGTTCCALFQLCDVVQFRVIFSALCILVEDILAGG